MSSYASWLETLNHSGAQLDPNSGAVLEVKGHDQVSFVDQPTVCALTDRTSFLISGPDTVPFLQGQVTCDVAALGTQSATYGAQCNPKGRAIFSFLALKRDADSVHIRLPRSMEPIARQSLGKYIVFSKADIQPICNDPIIGLVGSGAQALIEKIFGNAPAEPFTCCQCDAGTAIKLDSTRFECWLNPDMAAQTWGQLLEHADFKPTSFWDSNEIQAGIATVYPETSEEFVPQTINLVEIGAVSFTKGCYTGQEVVARMQYLGKQKRHTRIATANQSNPPAPGTDLLTSDRNRSIGKIVASSKLNEQQTVLLACLTDEAFLSNDVALESNPDEPISFLKLPYEFTPDSTAN